MSQGKQKVLLRGGGGGIWGIWGTYAPKTHYGALGQHAEREYKTGLTGTEWLFWNATPSLPPAQCHEFKGSRYHHTGLPPLGGDMGRDGSNA